LHLWGKIREWLCRVGPVPARNYEIRTQGKRHDEVDTTHNTHLYIPAVVRKMANVGTDIKAANLIISL
jgi:hypothetical protein